VTNRRRTRVDEPLSAGDARAISASEGSIEPHRQQMPKLRANDENVLAELVLGAGLPRIERKAAEAEEPLWRESIHRRSTPLNPFRNLRGGTVAWPSGSVAASSRALTKPKSPPSARS